MIQVKICGITNERDALAAFKEGAAAVGFIFYEHSPRYVTPEEALKIIGILPEKIVRVGVFVNEKAEEVKRIVRYCGLDFIQLHGDETVGYCRDFPPGKIIKAVSLRTGGDLVKAMQYNVAAILADNRGCGLYGGTGKKANWEMASRIKGGHPLILSGGLNENNVGQAITEVSPDALDICSGVETKPGIKDPDRMAKLFDAVRSASSKAGKRRRIFIRRRI